MVNNIFSDIKQLKNSDIRKTVDKRLKEFKVLNKKGNDEWFSELCFCILTANSKAKTAIEIQKQLGSKGFKAAPLNKLKQTILKNKHRFYNNKANFIKQARQHVKIKDIVQPIIKKHGEPEAREWIVKNIKGIGYKEASHFLRNVGYTEVAILDRHILNLLVDIKKIKEKPKTLNKDKYINIENVMKSIGKKMNMNQSELDLYMWYIKTGEILK